MYTALAGRVPASGPCEPWRKESAGDGLSCLVRLDGCDMDAQIRDLWDVPSDCVRFPRRGWGEDWSLGYKTGRALVITVALVVKVGGDDVHMCGDNK